MSGTLHLTITTPSAVLVDLAGVKAVRAEDESGGFGILPGHVNFLTALAASVVRWHDDAGIPHYCALSGGVLTVTEGQQVSIACRQATTGDDLSSLEADVQTMRAAIADTDRRSRVEQMRLHAHAVRQLMKYLRADSAASIQSTAPGGDIR